MARKRVRPESAYELRIRRYLEQHPGASRQEARGHKPPTGKTEYRQRVERAEQRRPGIPRAQAAGHRSANDLIQAIKTAPTGTLVSFLGLDRQSDGTWRRASFVLLAPDEPEREFILGPRQLGRLPEIADLIASRGITTLGADYMQSMVEWVEDQGEGLEE